MVFLWFSYGSAVQCCAPRQEFYRHFLADGLRPDGRGLRQQRSAELQRHALGDLVENTTGPWGQGPTFV